MPLIRLHDPLPSWCELRAYEIITLAPGDAHIFERSDIREKLIVDSGQCRVSCGDQQIQAGEGTNLDLSTPGDYFSIDTVTAETRLLRIAGHWGAVTGGSGLWHIGPSDVPANTGDTANYPHNTRFDSHYHDYDEYWIFFAGRGLAVSEGITYEVSPGDCIATGMGHHHDLPVVYAPIRAAFFETTLSGQGRRGHLWDHTHGLAQPQPERI